MKPLDSTVQKSLNYKPVQESSKLPRVTATIIRPVSPSVTAWDTVAQNIETSQQDTGDKLQRDMNYNFPVHTDQYGNVVQVQARQ